MCAGKGWSEDERAEVINGQLFYFAAPKILHQLLLLRLVAKWLHFIEELQGHVRCWLRLCRKICRKYEKRQQEKYGKELWKSNMRF